MAAPGITPVPVSGSLPGIVPRPVPRPFGAPVVGQGGDPARAAPFDAVTGNPRPAGRDGPMWAAAQALEASFLALMLEDAGVGEVPSSFGGGPGEAHFASFLREAQAKGMVEAGGIGLAESLFDAMKGRADV